MAHDQQQGKAPAPNPQAVRDTRRVLQVRAVDICKTGQPLLGLQESWRGLGAELFCVGGP